LYGKGGKVVKRVGKYYKNNNNNNNIKADEARTTTTKFKGKNRRIASS